MPSSLKTLRTSEPSARRPAIPRPGRTAARVGRAHLPLHTIVANEIRRALLTGAYKAGDRLVEERLAKEFGVSRVPVREALRTLASEGLIDVTARHGAMVPSLTPEQAQELIEVRANIEALNARLAARRHDPKIIARLQRILASGTKAAPKGSVRLLLELNDEFHNALAEAGSNRVLGDLMRSLRDRTAPAFSPTTPGQAKKTWEDHAEILRAVIDGDENLAWELASQLIHNVGSDYLATERKGNR
jgi:DNA-binding GntR family transcriptional regulator